ncbi:outer membrane protein assembly factor BamB family protein [Halobellus rubicundus]|uniref:PQQ-binding-like beta-propeller repeat protein n=1 Tax=Halobellus rubicundus TaxID=2996466 RepID=A0ABD5MBP1_9EURY
MVPPNAGSPAPGDGQPPLRERAASALTRRRILLAGGGLIGAGALGRLRTATPDALRVAEGVWPFADRDSARTSAAPAATPPTDPEVAWRREPVPVVDSLIAGPERLYAGSGEREGEPPRVAALDRVDGDVLWTVTAPGARLAYADGSVFATGATIDGPDSGADDGPRDAVARLDATTGETGWRRPLRNAGERLLVTRRTVYVGSHDGLAAFGRDDGRSLFRARLLGGPTTPLLADGSLVVAGGSVGRYAGRRWSDVVLKRLSEPVWSRQPIGYTLDPTVVRGATGRGVATGSFGLFDGEGTALRTHALADGTREWHAVEVERLPDPTVVKELASAGDRLYHGVRTGTDADRARRVVCRDASTGAVRWRRSLPNWLREVVVAGDLVLAGTRLDAVAAGSPSGPDGSDSDGSGSEPSPGRVTALSTGGEVRWRHRIGGAVSQVVPVSDRVFVGTDDLDYGGRSGAAGRVVALE